MVMPTSREKNRESAAIDRKPQSAAISDNGSDEICSRFLTSRTRAREMVSRIVACCICLNRKSTRRRETPRCRATSFTRKFLAEFASMNDSAVCTNLPAGGRLRLYGVGRGERERQPLHRHGHPTCAQVGIDQSSASHDPVIFFAFIFHLFHAADGFGGESPARYHGRSWMDV